MTIKTWNPAGGDGYHWTDTNNWLPTGVPTSSDDVVIAGSANIYTGVTSISFANFDASAYTGIFGGGLAVSYGTSMVLGAGMTWGCSDLQCGQPTLMTNGVKIGQMSGGNPALLDDLNVANMTINFKPDLASHDIIIQHYSFHGDGLSISPIDFQPRFQSDCAPGNEATWTSGKIRMTGTTPGVNEQPLVCFGHGRLPPVQIEGEVTLYDVRSFGPGYDLFLSNLTIKTGATVWWTGQRVTATGNITIESGATNNNLYVGGPGGALITCVNFSSQSNLVGTNQWFVNASGLAQLTGGHTLTYCDASGSAQLFRAYGQTDGGNNINVDFVGPPVVTDVSPDSGPAIGGLSVTINGSSFVSSTVTFGGVAATDVVVVDPATITCTIPAHAAGAVNVVVTNGDTRTGTGVDAFTFIVAPTITSITPPSSLPDGDDAIVVTGTHFDNGAVLTVDGVEPAVYTVDSPTQISFVSEAHAEGVVDLVVTNEDGQYATATFRFANVLPEACQINTITLKNNSAAPALFVDGALVAPGGTHVLNFVGLSCSRQDKLRTACENVALGDVFSIHDVDAGE